MIAEDEIVDRFQMKSVIVPMKIRSERTSALLVHPRFNSEL